MKRGKTSTTTTPSSKRSKISSDQVKLITPPKLVQSFLDFGQKNFENIICDACGMLFTPGLADEYHNNYCKLKTGKVKWIYSEDQVVLGFGEEKGSVIVANQSDSKCSALRTLVQEYLGISSEVTSSSVKKTSSFVYLLKSQAIGYLEVEVIKESNKLIQKKTQATNTEMNFCSDRTFPAKLGVIQIWVHENERRKKIASRLLDAARSFLGYPNAIPKEFVAFSQPTADGEAFASCYFGSDEFLVYKL